ncbi:MAG: SpoIID/LytB domain-containing protein [Gemmatimonadota bacterium]|nr:SpoIID/LytB domain-containing protein [Gemmatimonadota bacterium]
MTDPRAAASLGRSLVERFFLVGAAVVVLGCGGEASRGAGGSAEVEPPAPERFTAEPTVRVGIAWGDSAVRIGGDGRWWLHEAGSSRPIAVVEGEEGWRVVRLPFERSLRAERPDGFLSQPHRGPLVAAPLEGRPLVVNGTPYPGSVEVSLRPDGSVTAVDVVPMETYLEGVVAAELGTPGPAAAEALRAQAIAARTYALKRLGSRRAEGFDLYGGVEDQAYAGRASPADSLAVAAVVDTRGEALVYNGYLIDAFYHSTCGGHTARVEQVFDAAPAPYLVSVRDAPPGSEAFWCRESRYFRWRVAFDEEELQRTFERTLPGLVPLPAEGSGELRDVELLESSPEGRALAVRVTTSTGRFLVTENDIRRLFADEEGRWLRSTLFLFRPTRDASGIAGLTLVGGGWGHGVGMCQVGAMGRARAGQDHRAILAAYYPGTRIVRVY